MVCRGGGAGRRVRSVAAQHRCGGLWILAGWPEGKAPAGEPCPCAPLFLGCLLLYPPTSSTPGRHAAPQGPARCLPLHPSAAGFHQPSPARALPRALPPPPTTPRLSRLRCRLPLTVEARLMAWSAMAWRSKVAAPASWMPSVFWWCSSRSLRTWGRVGAGGGEGGQVSTPGAGGEGEPPVPSAAATPPAYQGCGSMVHRPSRPAQCAAAHLPQHQPPHAPRGVGSGPARQRTSLEAASRALEGTQPRLTQVPPMSWPSTMATLRPCRCAVAEEVCWLVLAGVLGGG